ncbi:putative Bacitracin transport ATP-binding protein BcrA [Streptomyces afghaniensis 772]|uniref:Putative Bacitracin transport ATP-binding protein BcrA n=1 Tax=Streptomyces afghaniensis 772 TaxID=1283301 RepID=S4MGU4_9ACTN|nr:putative Bacitracin transport ATP-binding protein BcrA [Streptomyces afghaniensis 772]
MSALLGRRRGVPVGLALAGHRHRGLCPGRQRLLEAFLLVDGRAVVDGALRHPHVRLLQRGLVRRQLPQPYVVVVRDVADAGERQPGHAQCAVLLGQHVPARLGERGRQLLALLRLGVRRPDACEVRGVRGDEGRDTHVRQELPAPDDDEMVGGQRHLAHQMGGDEDRTALRGECLHQVAHPEDALGVEAVDRLVEQQHLRVAEQRGGDAQPLSHAEGEALGPLPGHVLEAHDPEHLVHPFGRDARQLGQAQQVVAGGPAAVHGLGVQQGTDLTGGVGQLAIRVTADRHVPGRRVVQAEDHPHRRRLARAVRSEEARDGPRPHLEGKVVHSGLVAVALRQADCFDHAPHPSQGSGQRGTRPRKG